MAQKIRWAWNRVIVALVALAVLGVVYCYLAFAPTGYRQVEAGYKKAVERINESARLAPSGTERPIAQAAMDAPGAGDATSSASSQDASRLGNRPSMTEIGRLFEDLYFAYSFMNTQSLSWTDSPSFSNHSLPCAELAECDWFALATMASKARQSTIASVKRSIPYDSLRRREELDNPFQGPPGTASRAEVVRIAGLELDQIRSILLDPSWDTTTYEDLPSEIHHLSAVANPLELAILRALQRGEAQEASQLLERAIRVESLAVIAQFPSAVTASDSAEAARQMARVLFDIAQMDSFPEEGLARAAAALERWKLAPEQIADLRVAFFHRMKERLLTELDRHDAANFEMNGWHLFLDGIPERAVTAALKPVLAKQIEEFAVAMASGDTRATAPAEKQMELLKRLMNLSAGSDLKHLARGYPEAPSGNPLLAQLQLLGMESRAKAKPLNDAIDFACFVLAGERFRRDHGQYPKAVEEMMPQYLDASFRPTSDTVWAIACLEPFQSLMIPRVKEYNNKEPYAMAVSRYRKDWHEHGKQGNFNPETIDDLRPSASSDAEWDSFRSRIERHEGRPIFMRFNRRIELNDTWNRFRNQSPGDYPSLPKELGGLSFEEEIKRELKEASECFEAVVFVPRYPLMKDQFLEFLKEAKHSK